MWVGNPDTVMFVAGTPTALALRFNNAGPQLFDYMIVSCPQVADDTIVAIATEEIATGFDGLPPSKSLRCRSCAFRGHRALGYYDRSRSHDRQKCVSNRHADVAATHEMRLGCARTWRCASCHRRVVATDMDRWEREALIEENDRRRAELRAWPSVSVTALLVNCRSSGKHQSHCSHSERWFTKRMSHNRCSSNKAPSWMPQHRRDGTHGATTASKK